MMMVPTQQVIHNITNQQTITNYHSCKNLQVFIHFENNLNNIIYSVFVALELCLNPTYLISDTSERELHVLTMMCCHKH
jgi:hypothetical protein